LSLKPEISGFIVFINCFSLRKVVAKFNIVASLAKIFVISTILVIGAIWLLQGHVKNFEQPFHVQQPLTAIGLIGAFFAALFTYDGWDVLNFGAEEISHFKA
jgi:amino acid transporter